MSGLWERHRTLREIEKVTKSTKETVEDALGNQVRVANFFWSTNRALSKDDLPRPAKSMWWAWYWAALSAIILRSSESGGGGAHLKFVVLDYQNDMLMATMPLRALGPKPLIGGALEYNSRWR